MNLQMDVKLISIPQTKLICFSMDKEFSFALLKSVIRRTVATHFIADIKMLTLISAYMIIRTAEE